MKNDKKKFQNNYNGREPMTEQEMAKFLKVSQSSLYRWRKAEEIPFSNMGKMIYYFKEDVLLVLGRRSEMRMQRLIAELNKRMRDK